MNLSNCASNFSIEDLASDAQRAMFGYWQNARGNAPLPLKSALDPVALPRQALSSLAVVEPVDNDDFRVRIIGTGVRAAVGRDVTGQQISHIDGAGETLENLRLCHAQAATFYTCGPATWAGGRQKFYTSLMLPFGTPGHIERVMAVFQFTYHTPESLSASWPQVAMLQH
tara:strand:+ start:463 stop:972 length:510 start_codon:yes stop_codon:yes gene_type:complete